MIPFNSRVLKMDFQVTGIALNHDQAELAREKYQRLISGGFYYKS